MPMIQTKTNIEISNEQELALKTALGKAISILSGKSEQWLMLSFEEKCHLYFKGDNSSPMAFVEVKVYGKIDYTQANRLTGEICRIFKEILSISPDKVYVKYEEVEMWGWNSNNF